MYDKLKIDDTVAQSMTRLNWFTLKTFLRRLNHEYLLDIEDAESTNVALYVMLCDRWGI